MSCFGNIQAEQVKAQKNQPKDFSAGLSWEFLIKNPKPNTVKC